MRSVHAGRLVTTNYPSPLVQVLSLGLALPGESTLQLSPHLDLFGSDNHGAGSPVQEVNEQIKSSWGFASMTFPMLEVSDS